MDNLIQDELQWLIDLCQNQKLCDEVDEILDNLRSLSSETDSDEIEELATDFDGFVDKLNGIEACFVFAMLRGDDESFNVVANMRSSFSSQSQIRDFEQNVSCSGINYQFSLDRFSWNWCTGEPLVTDWGDE